MNYFLSETHEIRFNELCSRDRTHRNDIERRTLFFVISGNKSLYYNVDLLYDFDKKIIRLEVYNQPFLEGGTRSLIDLAFHLYGSDAGCEIRHLFDSLDRINSILTLKAIKFRYQIWDEQTNMMESVQ